ncbi:MAG: hypothetical protein KC442_18140 [Thermomicrobiales bacterium]|nr:hypothetical protein [Thermomicrobiales bacterium]
MSIAIHLEEDDVNSRLAALGLCRTTLLEAVAAGFAAFSNADPLAPKTFPGTVAWADTVARLAALMRPSGWTREDDRNMPFVVRGDGKIALTVWTGNALTGNPHRQPNVRARRGKKTSERVAGNVRQLGLGLAPVSSSKSKEHNWLTWALLIFRDEVRRRVVSELSLPVSVSPDHKVVGWDERILLPAIEFDDDHDTGVILDGQPDGPEPEIDISIRRRA